MDHNQNPHADFLSDFDHLNADETTADKAKLSPAELSARGSIEAAVSQESSQENMMWEAAFEGEMGEVAVDETMSLEERLVRISRFDPTVQSWASEIEERNRKIAELTRAVAQEKRVGRNGVLGQGTASMSQESTALR